MLLLCFICPPLAVLFMGRPFSAILNSLLTLFLFWVPGIKHALVVYADWKSERQVSRIVTAINHPAYLRSPP